MPAARLRHASLRAGAMRREGGASHRAMSRSGRDRMIHGRRLSRLPILLRADEAPARERRAVSKRTAGAATRRSTRIAEPTLQGSEDGCAGGSAGLLQTGNQRSVLCFKRDEGPKQGTRAELFDVTAEDPRKQRARRLLRRPHHRNGGAQKRRCSHPHRSRDAAMPYCEARRRARALLRRPVWLFR